VDHSWVLQEESEVSEECSHGGFGIGPVLFVVFLVLKLTHVIDWSWWWVTAPLWGTAILCIIGLIAALVVLAVAVLVDK
jgi:hypothetical protein